MSDVWNISVRRSNEFYRYIFKSGSVWGWMVSSVRMVSILDLRFFVVYLSDNLVALRVCHRFFADIGLLRKITKVLEKFSYDFRELGDFLDPALGLPFQIFTNGNSMDRILPHFLTPYQKSFSLFASRFVLHILQNFASVFCMDFRDLFRFQNHPT